MSIQTITPAFLTTAAISKLPLRIAGWAEGPQVRAYFEGLAKDIINKGELGPLDARAALKKMIEDNFQADGGHVKGLL